MDKIHILKLLSLPENSTIKFTHLEMVLWGRELHFHVLAGGGESVECELRFGDCRDMRWQVYSHMQHAAPESFPLTELMDFRMGRSQHRSPTRLLTDHFGLSLFYGTLHLVYNADSFCLSDDE